MAPRGRPRKSIAELKLAGTYRHDRHGDRDDAPLFDDSPSRPKGMDKIAAKYWREVIQPLIDKKAVNAVDRPALEALANFYAVYHTQMRAYLENPTSVGLFNMMNKSWSTYSRLAASFGLTPKDRSNVAKTVPKKERPKSQLASFLDGSNSQSASALTVPSSSQPVQPEEGDDL